MVLRPRARDLLLEVEELPVHANAYTICNFGYKTVLKENTTHHLAPPGVCGSGRSSQ